MIMTSRVDNISFNSSANVLGSEVLHQTMCCLVNIDSGSGGYVIDWTKTFFQVLEKVLFFVLDIM